MKRAPSVRHTVLISSAMLAALMFAGLRARGADSPANLIVNGGFEEPVISGSFGIYSAIPGWTASPGSPDFELQASGSFGSPFEGNQHCELDAYASSAIGQEVPTAPGRVYELSFAFSPRPRTGLLDNVLAVRWDGEEVTTLAEDGTGLGDTEWTTHTFLVVGGPNETTSLEFEDLGLSNTLGTYLDAVTMTDLGFAITGTVPRYVQLGKEASARFEASGGTDPYVWSRVDGTLPPGLTLDATGELSGTPHTLGSFAFAVEATDGSGETAAESVTVDVVLVVPAPDIRLFKSSTALVPGRTVDQFIVVQNVGEVPATDVQVVDMLDPSFELQFVSADGETDGETLEEATVVVWDAGTLEPNDTRVFTNQVRIAPSTPIGAALSRPTCTAAQLDELGECLEDLSQDECSIVGGVLCTAECALIPFDCARGPIPCANALLKCASCIGDCGGGTSACLEDAGCLVPTEPTRGPLDPNEKVVLAARYIQPDQELIYPIHFENIGEVEALDVFITDVLDANLDDATLELLTPEGASYDPKTRTLRWALLGRNLPPGQTDNVLLSIKPVPGLPSGTEIRNRAEIQFEVFEPLITADVVNIIDTTVPSCTVDPLPDTVTTDALSVTWTVDDAVGEVDEIVVFVAQDDGHFEVLTETTDLSTTLPVEPDHAYGFFCVAADTAGNIEEDDLVAEATTLVVRPVPGDGAGIEEDVGCSCAVGTGNRSVWALALGLALFGLVGARRIRPVPVR